MTTPPALQVCPPLTAAIEAALRASIERFGVLVPVVHDQHGRVLDGHHRARLADALGIQYRVDTIRVADAAEAQAVAVSLNVDRRHLSAAQRQEIAQTLRAEGHSLRAIAGALGVSLKKVRGDMRTVPKGTVPDRVRGLDGKSRPARRPTVVPAKNVRDARSVQELLAAAPLLPAVVEPRRLARVTRQAAAAVARQATAPERETIGTVVLRHGDFAAVLANVRQVDAIITDPPYGRGALPLLSALATFAARALKRSGLLVVMVGQLHLAETLRRLDEHLAYRWTACYLARGPRTTRVHAARVATYWKPLLLYARRDHSPWPWLLVDTIANPEADKSHHDWGQGEAGVAALVERFTAPGDFVVDPFLGGGTTAVVCQRLGRRFVGCDRDGAALAATRTRLKKTHAIRA